MREYALLLYHLVYTRGPLEGSFTIGGHFVHAGPYGLAVNIQPGWDRWMLLSSGLDKVFRLVSQECDAVRFVHMDLLPGTARDFDPEVFFPEPKLGPLLPPALAPPPPILRPPFEPTNAEVQEAVAEVEARDQVHDEKVYAVVDRIFQKTKRTLDLGSTEQEQIRQWLVKFDLSRLLTAVDAAHAHYFDPDHPVTSFGKFFEKIPAVAYVDQGEDEDPYLKQTFYIRGILRKRLSYVSKEARPTIHRLLKLGASYEALKKAAQQCDNWTDFVEKANEIEAVTNLKRSEAAA